MNKESIKKITENYVKTNFNQESTGHDWWHIKRVYDLSLQINEIDEKDINNIIHSIENLGFKGGFNNNVIFYNICYCFKFISSKKVQFFKYHSIYLFIK